VTATIADVRAALADAVLASGIERCNPYLDDIINPPEVQIGRAAMNPDMVFNNAKSAYAFSLFLYVPRAPVLQSQQMIDEYCEINGDRSIRAAVAAAANWPSPAIVDYAKVTLIGETTVVEREGTQFLQVQIDVEVVW
jgi:hypothetical protein